MKTIQEHLAVKKTDRDLAWIKSALQAAIELEHSTLPLYLSAMLSLDTQNYTTYNLIRSIIMEEMVHMAIDCNMLSILGGRPNIKTISPTFPGKGLPGGAEPDVEAVVAKFSKKQLLNFMRIECPVFLLNPKFKTEKYASIGTFYAAIKAAIQDNAKIVEAAMKAGGASIQVGDDIGFTTFKYPVKGNPIKQLVAGINEITEQGEGTGTGDLLAGNGSQDETSHYLRFAEIFYGASYTVPTKKIKLTAKTLPSFFKGLKNPAPEVVNSLVVPSDGYAALLKLDPNGKEVEKGLLAFDAAYTGIMDNLDGMWNGLEKQQWPTFGEAVGNMSKLRPINLVSIKPHQIPDNLIKQLPKLYPTEYKLMAKYTDLKKPVFYGPRFFNLNVKK